MGRYRLGKPIGYGGMAVVYEAWRLFPDASSFPVAFKRILPQYSKDEVFAKLLHREARVCMQLSHPNLVAVYDFDRDEDEQLFLVMERVDGVAVSVASTLEELEYPVIRRILRDVLRALAYVHERGVVHRDISPCNILLSRTGEVKLSDFGLARSTVDGVRSGFGFKGKAAYASPEAIQCTELGPSADLYSLASVLYELITGKPPFDYGHVMQINRRMSEWHIAPLGDDVPEDLRALTMGMLRYTAEERAYPSAEGMLAELERFAQPVADCVAIAALVARTDKESLLVAGKRGNSDAPPASNIEIQPEIEISAESPAGQVIGGGDEARRHGTVAVRPPRERGHGRRSISVRAMLYFGVLMLMLGGAVWAHMPDVRLAPAARTSPKPGMDTSQESGRMDAAVQEPGWSRNPVDTEAAKAIEPSGPAQPFMPAQPAPRPGQRTGTRSTARSVEHDAPRSGSHPRLRAPAAPEAVRDAVRDAAPDAGVTRRHIMPPINSMDQAKGASFEIPSVSGSEPAPASSTPSSSHPSEEIP